MKNRVFAITIKKAALAAAFFIAAIPAFAEALDDSPGLKAADERGQRLFDQAVKLHRRHAANPKTPAEPFKSILLELSLYHDEELATYLSDMGPDGSRSEPVHLAPWALHRLALLDMQRGSYEEAITHFHDLGERFSGAKVIEPADGEMASVENAEAASLRGQISAFLLYAKQQKTKDVVGALEDRIETLHEKFGAESMPGHHREGSYSEFSLDALWQALTIDKAGFKPWQKATLTFIKREKSESFKRAIFEALAEGCSKLGKKDEADQHLKSASKLVKSGDDFKAPRGLFSNLIKT